MTVPKRVIPDANLSPGSQQWGREQQGAAISNRDALNQLASRNNADYQQFNAAVTGAAEQTYKVRDSVYQLPGAWVYQAKITNFSLPAATWTTMFSVRLPFPRGKARAMVYANTTVNMVTGGSSLFVGLGSGIGRNLDVGVPSIDYASSGGKFYRLGQFTHSGVFELARRGGSTTSILQLWAGTAVPADAENVVTFNVYYLYGGGTTQ